MMFEVIAQPGAAPDAVLSTPEPKPRGAGSESPHSWLSGHSYKALQLAPNALFDAKLSLRWGCVVACTAEFSRWWGDKPGARPHGFFLTLLSGARKPKDKDTHEKG